MTYFFETFSKRINDSVILRQYYRNITKKKTYRWFNITVSTTKVDIFKANLYSKYQINWTLTLSLPIALYFNNFNINDPHLSAYNIAFYIIT